VADFIKGDWLRTLFVNKELTNPVNGAFKVAARTVLGEAVQSNPQSGHAIIGGTFTAAAAGTEIRFRIRTPEDDPLNPNVDTDGNVLRLEYYDSGTSSWVECPPPIAVDTGSRTFDLSGAGVGGLTVQIARVVSYNTPGSMYSFTVPTSMQGMAAGDNAINLCNRLKKDISATIGHSSLDTYYSTVIGILGSQAKDAIRLAENQKAVTDQLLGLRESVCGVNQEEELVDMVRFQKGYNAASRILTAIDEMLDKLINGTGVVGR
jgi:flagellar hook-associated protein 1 FlgK